MRLRRADPGRPGYTRRRAGRGFSYRGPDGTPITDPQLLARIRALAIPPAWRQVWICTDPRGHIQAIGVDQAGRRQYRYHDVWRAKRDAAKFDHVLEVAERLPELRAKVAADLRTRGLNRRRVLATAVRLLDLGLFRVGGEAYAAENGASEASYGLATLLREHTTVTGSAVEFCYRAKAGVQRRTRIVDRSVATVVGQLLDRDDPHPELLGYLDGDAWRDVRSGDVNDYLKDATGCQVSAKDFRTWHATVLAAVSLAGSPAATPTARKKAVGSVMREVAEYLGNTPAVAKASYVDPRVIDLFHQNVTVALPPLAGGWSDLSTGEDRRHAERAVLELLASD
jgi:DNA topoisomerase IB